MRMPRTLRPHGVDELIMDVLLCRVDNTLNVTRGVIDKRPKPGRVVQDQVVMTNSDCCVQIVNKQPDDLFLDSIRYRHLS